MKKCALIFVVAGLIVLFPAGQTDAYKDAISGFIGSVDFVDGPLA